MTATTLPATGYCIAVFPSLAVSSLCKGPNVRTGSRAKKVDPPGVHQASMGGTPRHVVGRGGGVATHARRERMGGMAPQGAALMLLLLLLLLLVLLSWASFCTSVPMVANCCPLFMPLGLMRTQQKQTYKNVDE